ncbi:Conserved_hypothetical protein [Hexamita inflata]|uniref:Uncharacterized protein n=1 Tax=Hexamita inflata TaxID=28002 RepID=A0AA86RL41_9EUKA|nr:Conserved hypothetical protein [Hexamita inflata]
MFTLTSFKCTNQYISQQICSNINIGSYKSSVGYCLKESYLSSLVQSGSIAHSHGKHVHYTLFTTKVQDLQMNITYQMADLPSFALFGLTQSIQLQNSNFSVFIPQQLAQGAIVCLQCDVNVSTSDFLFSASGQNISGLVLIPFKILILNNLFTQFRLNGINVGGVLLNGSGIDYSLDECNISGYIVSQKVSGSIAAFVGVITIHATNVRVCTNVGRFGQGSVNMVGITDICDLCRSGIYAYGLCQKAFNNSYYNNSQLVCLDSFYFDGEECSCPEGHIVNDSSCVKILDSVNNLITKIAGLESQMNYMQDIIANLVKQINCTNLGKQYIGGSCIDVSCPILGQKQINGKCQCSNTNAIVQNFICICPQYSILISSVCTGPENSVFIDGAFQCVGDLIMQAGVCSCPTVGAAFYNGACTCGVNGQNISNTCSCPVNSVLVSGECTCIVFEQTIQSGQCVCPSGQSLVNGLCYTDVIINGSDNILQCSQSMHVTTFDIQTVTNLLPTPLSFSQYLIFTSSNDITNAFIDISNNVYTTVNPLFQSQLSFYNIKIQIGTQTMTSGSILTPDTTTTIQIYQMNILSKAGSTLTLSSSLNIFMASSTCTIISTLLVNLNFVMSSGSITLINTANGIMNISGYVVLGSYQSSSVVAMLSVTVCSETVYVSYVSFKPTVYNVGNRSSYLFSNVTSNSFTVCDIAIVIGNNSLQQVLTSVSSIVINGNQFGGIITNIISTSEVTICNVISDCYQQISTSYINYSGLILGWGHDSSSSISITNVCLQQKITSSTQFQNLGLVGQHLGYSSLQQIIVTVSAQGNYFNHFGLVGQQFSASADVANVQTIISVSNNTGQNIGALFGFQGAINCSIKNTSVFNSSIISQCSVGGLIGWLRYYQNNLNISIYNAMILQSNISVFYSSVGGLIGYCNFGNYDYNSNISIYYSTVQNSFISGLSNVGGIIGHQLTYAVNSTYYTDSSQLLIKNSNISQNNISGSNIGGFIGNSTNYKTTIIECIIQQVRITAQNSQVGIVLGFNNGFNTFSFSSSSSIVNYINDVLQYDCASISNAFTQIGC